MKSEKLGAQLDPFTFPPETNARFNLLIFGAIVTVLSLSITMWERMTIGSPISKYVDQMADLQTQVANWRIILFVVGSPIVCGLIIFALLGLAYFNYRKHPDRIILQKKLEAPKPERDQKFIESVTSLAKMAGLEVTPEILIGPPRAQDGQAFGLIDKPILRLGSNLKWMRLKQELKPVYQAVILHEMAHIFNQDVQRSYFAEALWSALRVVTIPLAVLIVFGYLPSLWKLDYFLWIIFIPVILLISSLFVTFELGVIFAVLQLIRRSALRVREIYADVRAVQWGAHEGLTRILSSIKDKKRNLWQRIWKFHPKASQRLEHLQNPDKLFRISIDLPLSLGFLFGMVMAGGSPILIRASQLRQMPGSGFEGIPGLIVLAVAVFIYFGLTFLLSWLMASGMGLQVQRQTAYDQAHDIGGLTPYLRMLFPALVFHLAFEAGVMFMPYNYIQIDPFTLIGRPILLLIFPFWMLFAVFTLWIWMGLNRFFTATSESAPHPRQYQAITAISTTILPFLYIPSALARYWLLDLTNRNILPAVLSLPVIFILVLIVCLAGRAWLKKIPSQSTANS